MGLDNFWKLPEGSTPPTFDPPLRLCAGMLSSNGEGSFRGKVYDPILEALSAPSLYSETLSNQEIQTIANILEKTPYEAFQTRLQKTNTTLNWPINREEYEDLTRMFSTYAQTGATLHGWW
jgi:hypothetical protein